MPHTDQIIAGLIDEHLEGVPGAQQDRPFLEAASKEFYVASVAEAKEMLAGFGVTNWNQKFDEYCGRIGFLRAVNALARHKMGKPYRPARFMSS